MQLSLDHLSTLRPLWKELCLKFDLRFAEYSFANNFLFRERHHYVFVDSDPPYIVGQFDDGKKYTIPTLPPSQCSKQISDCLFPIPEEWLAYFEKEYTFSCSDNDSDYLFQKEHLALLSGRQRASRRNLIHQLEEDYTLTSAIINQNEAQDVLTILEEWQLQSHKNKAETDYFPALDALNHREVLELFGCIVYANGRPAGYVLGELLTPKIALLHTAKALRQYKGMMPYLFRDFAQKLPGSVLWINLEQDLGLPSLRQAKNAYQPDQLAKKWKVSAIRPTP